MVAPTGTPKVAELVRAIVLDSNPTLSNLNDLGESNKFTGTSNRPIGTLLGPRKRAG
jgi:hypothetical protein